jgi:serine/threonine-protein kinase
MDREAWERLEALVDRALDLPDAEREGLVREVTARDPALGRELEAFLATEGRSRGFLDAPVEVQAEALLAAIGRGEDEAPGRLVGPYRLLSELGRGGMGAVFLAERADGQFDQRVALKLVQRGLDSAEILERFRAERQILAGLQHPHIARLLDGGVTADGQPYFAMEHVDGRPIGVFCDQCRLGVRARVRLFLQVCDAVEYAHRNLVVHRDLKPSNVLVTAESQAKLLDFGIAKVLDPARDRDAGLTRDARPMTPQYAAPEQLRGEAVTTATDVYSLGVVLYHLLCGRQPYRIQRLTPAEVERVVTGQDPPPPSAAARAATEDGPSPEEIAAARSTGVDRLARDLRGDLDTVVAKALRKEPQRRYASVRDLAEDLRRHLAGLPVTARPDTWRYRAGKFVSRHRAGVTAAALIALSLVAGLVGTLWEARAAVRQARKAEQVQQFVFGVFGQSDPNAAKGKDMTARQLLDEGARRIRTELATQPEMEAEMLLFVGNIDYRIGLAAESRPLYERALELRRGLFGEQSLEVAEAETALGTVCLMQGELPRARELLESAVRKRARRLPDDDPDLALARGLLGRVRLEQGDTAEAERLLAVAVAAGRARSPHAELATNLTALGRVLHAKGDYDGAEAAFREALTLRVQLFGEEHTRVSESRANLAAVMRDRGDFRGAEPWFRQVVDMDRRLLGSRHEKVAVDLTTWGSRWCRRADTPKRSRSCGSPSRSGRPSTGPTAPRPRSACTPWPACCACSAGSTRPSAIPAARWSWRERCSARTTRTWRRCGRSWRSRSPSAARTPKRRSWRGAPWRPTRPSWRTTIHHWPART